MCFLGRLRFFRYSILILATFTIRAHLTRSERMNAVNSSGELPTVSVPTKEIFSSTSGCRSTLTVSPCSRAMVSFGTAPVRRARLAKELVAF